MQPHFLRSNYCKSGLAPIFPYTFYHLTHYWFAAADIPVANDTPVHYADAIRCNFRKPPQGSLPLLTRRVSAPVLPFWRTDASDKTGRLNRCRSATQRKMSQVVTEATLHCTQHDVLHGFTVISTGTGRPVKCLTIADLPPVLDTTIS